MTLKKVKLVGGEELLAHTKKQCLGTYCTIHKFSDHHMVKWTQHWRGDRGIMERICAHGIGHPDPDDIRITNGSDDGTHGCDGCCWDSRKNENENENEKEKETEMVDIQQQEPGTTRIYIDDLIEKVAVDLMVTHGWDLEKRGENTIEWDPNRPDSQFAMMIEDAKRAVESTFQYLNAIEIPEEDDEHEGMHHHGDGNWHSHVELDEEDWEEVEEISTSNGSFKKYTTTSYVLTPSPANIVTLGDIRAWIKAVDAENLPDSHEVDDAVLAVEITKYL